MLNVFAKSNDRTNDSTNGFYAQKQPAKENKKETQNRFETLFYWCEADSKNWSP